MTDTVAELRGDAAPECFSLLLRFHGVAIDPAQIRHRFGGATIGIAEMLRCAREFNFKARLIVADWPRLAKLALPVIAECSDGGFLVVARIADDNAIVQVGGRPRLMSRSQFQAFCSGRFVLLTRRASLRDLGRRFDISWFLQAMQKYRRLWPGQAARSGSQPSAALRQDR